MTIGDQPPPHSTDDVGAQAIIRVESFLPKHAQGEKDSRTFSVLETDVELSDEYLRLNVTYPRGTRSEMKGWK